VLTTGTTAHLTTLPVTLAVGPFVFASR